MKGTLVYIRKLQPSDYEFIFKCENNPENWLVSNTKTDYSESIIYDFVTTKQDLNKNKQYRFIICSVATKQPLGTLDLFDFDSDNKRVGVGVLIAEKTNRRKGYAKEALQLIIHFCHQNLQLHQLYCNIISTNISSKNLFINLGFQYIGTKKDWIFFDGKWYDEELYQKIV